MYSYEDRMHAVKLYIQYDYSFASVKRELGYPKQRASLQQWLTEYQEHSDLKHKSSRESKYSTDQRVEAINHYYIVRQIKRGSIRHLIRGRSAACVDRHRTLYNAFSADYS